MGEDIREQRSGINTADSFIWDFRVWRYAPCWTEERLGGVLSPSDDKFSEEAQADRQTESPIKK